MFTCLTVPSILPCKQAIGTWGGEREGDLLCCLSKPQRGIYHKVKSCQHITLLPLPPLGYGQELVKKLLAEMIYKMILSNTTTDKTKKNV